MKNLLKIFLLFIALQSYGQGAFTCLDPRNDNEVYRNEFTDINSIDIITFPSNGTIAMAAPVSDSDLTGNVMSMEWVNAGSNFCGARFDLGTVYDEVYISFYVRIIDYAGETGLRDFAYFTEGSTNVTEAFELQANVTSDAVGHRWFTTDNTVRQLNGYFTRGVWVRYGVHINNLTRESNHYINGKLETTFTHQSRDVQWVTFGGFHEQGYKFEIANFTANTTNFSKGIDNIYGIGEKSVIYVDPSLATNTDYNGVDLSALDRSSWRGQHRKAYSIDGSTNYIDGPLTYSADVSSNYLDIPGEVLYFSGATQYQKDLATTNGISFVGSPTSATEFYTLATFGGKTKAKLTNGVIYDGSWTVDDAPNNVYRSGTIANIGNLSGVSFLGNDAFALRESTNLADFSTYSGIYYVDGSEILVKLWDGSNPTGQECTLRSNQGFTTNDFTKIKNLEFNSGGITPGENSELTYLTFTKGSGLSLSDNSKCLYSTFSDQWIGGQYQDATLGGRNQPLSIGNNAILAYCDIEDGYIGTQVDWGTVSPLIAYNVIKNNVVNHAQFSGTATPHSSSADAMMFINNTVFVSPRHNTDIPYPMTESSTGHGIVLQSGGTNNWITITNNMYLLLFNRTNLTGTGIGNCFSGGGGANITMDFNIYYKSLDCDLNGVYFTSGDDNDFSAHQTRLNSGSNTGIGGIIEANSSIVTELPVLVANGTSSSGKWLETDPTPTVTGNGTYIDLRAYGIVHTKSGKKIDSLNPNIGAN